jgi:hypothetical protein
MKHTTSTALLSAMRGLRICNSSSPRPISSIIHRPVVLHNGPHTHSSYLRPFSSTATRQGTWLEPRLDRNKKMIKGRPRVATGGSTKGTTVMWGDYGLRMKDHHRRISAKQLKNAEDTIKTRLRGQKYRLYKRICCNVGVFVSGNEVRFTDWTGHSKI